MFFGVIVKITDDFDLQKIADSGQCFRCQKTDFGFRFVAAKSALAIRKIDEVTYSVSCSEEEWNAFWIPYFDLGRNYNDVRSAASPGDFLGRAAAEGRGVRILRQDPWEMLLSFIISQRKSIPAIKKSVESLCDLYGGSYEMPGGTVRLFPEPKAIYDAREEELGSCGLGYRVPYIKDAAWKVYRGDIDLEALKALDDDSLLASLKSVKGVGDKVANCVMLFAYGRMSSVPVDTWIKKIIRDKYGGMDPFPQYGENAGIFQQYAFYYIQKHKSEVV